jgi:hypothetical protein
MFDICSDACDSYPEAELSSLPHALSYFDGVLGWTIGDINYVLFLQIRAGLIQTP